MYEVNIESPERLPRAVQSMEGRRFRSREDAEFAMSSLKLPRGAQFVYRVRDITIGESIRFRSTYYPERISWPDTWNAWRSLAVGAGLIVLMLGSGWILMSLIAVLILVRMRQPLGRALSQEARRWRNYLVR